MKNKNVSHSVVSDYLRAHGLSPTRLLCPWNSPGRNTRIGCHSLLQGALLQKHKPAKRKDPEMPRYEDFTQNSHTSTNFTVKPSRWPVLQHRDAKAGFSCFHCRCERRAKNYQSFEKNVYMAEGDQNKQKNENISHPWNKKKTKCY